MKLRSLLMAALVLAPLFAFCAAPPTAEQAKAIAQQGRFLATITMADAKLKPIELVLEGSMTPYTVSNFINLTQANFYDGLTFYDVIDEQSVKLIQGGDACGDGTGNAGYALNLEVSPYLSMKKGAILMFHRQNTDSASSQFVILRNDMTQLDGVFSVFGWVKSGTETVDAIKIDDVMKTVSVVPYDGKEVSPILTPEKPALKCGPKLSEVNAVKAQGRYLATITMANDKVIELVLEGTEAPHTVANFINLINQKFYDGIPFHRVEDGEGFQLIQGGDPLGNDPAKAGSGGPGYSINLEISPGLRHRTGALAMARSQEPNSAGSQFYITNCDIEQLDDQYAVFGWVKSGQDVAKAVKEGDKMKTVTVAPYNGKEAIPIAPLPPPPPAPPAEKIGPVGPGAGNMVPPVE